MKIAFLGDIAMFGCYDIISNPDLKKELCEIKKYLSSFDLVVGNLESPFSKAKKKHGAKSAYLFSEIQNVEILKELNISVINLANNHLFDYGKEGYETTKMILEHAGIKYYGIEGKSVDVAYKGNRIRFTGYCCYSTNPLNLSENQGGYGINKYNLLDVRSAMQQAHKDGYLNVVAVHAGLEHVNFPSLEHIRAARFLADDFPFIYYGHHPHVVQGVEEHRGSLLAYSLGNFCFDDIYVDSNREEPLVRLTEQNRTGLILEVEIENNKVIEWREQLIHIESSGAIMIIKDIDNVLQSYNERIRVCETNPEYETTRRKIISDRITERKAGRDVRWVIKRLRPRYIRLIFDMKRNAHLYYKNVKQYLGNDEL